MDPKRIGACTLGLRMLDLEGALDELKQLGYHGVDLWQVSPYYQNKGHVSTDSSPEERRRVKQLVADRGLESSHLAAYAGMKFSDPEESERQQDSEWARQTIDLAADLGIRVMRIGCGRSENISGLDTFAPLLRQAADHAKKKGIRLDLETHHGMPTMRTDWMRQIFDAVGADNLGVLYDPGNLAPGEMYKRVLDEMPDRVFHVHFKNVHLKDDGRSVAGWAEPGQGDVDMDWVLRGLADCGYAGRFAVEYEKFSEDVTLDDARQGLTQWQRFLERY